jgi:hypothetical protein
MTKTKHHDDDVEAKPHADGPTQLLHPLYNYGPPTTVGNTATDDGTPQDNSTAVTVTINGASNHVPPANTSGNVGKNGSPSEEIVGLYTPTLASLAPGVANAAVVCTGTAFFAATATRPGSTVLVNGSPVPTTFTSATSISGTFNHATAVAGTVSVNVSNVGAVSTTPRTFTYT